MKIIDTLHCGYYNCVNCSNRSVSFTLIKKTLNAYSCMVGHIMKYHPNSSLCQRMEEKNHRPDGAGLLG